VTEKSGPLVSLLFGLEARMSLKPPPDGDNGSPVAGEGLAPGSGVAGYVVLERIGRGGMAVVYRARDDRLGRVVALKVLAPVLAEDEGFRQRFIRESRAAAAVDDPHIIPVHEAGEAGGVLFIAMRFVAGGDVRSMLRRSGPMPTMRTAAIISPVAAALDAAHAAGLIHRDVKPANMLLDARPGRPDHVYLSDFGLAKGALSSVGLTGTGLFLGTPDYISPEQVAGRPVDGRADQYSLACAAYEMLAGEPPFVRDHGMAVVYAHASETPPALSSRCPDLPAEADAALARALAKDPDDRYGDCHEFAETLRAALGLPPYDPELASGERASPAQARSRPGTEAAHAVSPGGSAPPVAAEITGQPGTPEAPQAGAPSFATTVHSATISTPRQEQQPAMQATARRDYRDRSTGTRRTHPPRRRATVILASAIIGVAATAAILATTLRPAGSTVASHSPNPAITGRLPSLATTAPSPSLATRPAGSPTAALQVGNSPITLGDPHSRTVASVAFSPDGKIIAAGDWNGNTYLWNVSGHSLIATLPGTSANPVFSVAFSPEGKTIAVGAGSTNLWDVSSRSLIATLTDPSGSGDESIAFSPDGKTLAVGDANGVTYLWDASSQSLIAPLYDSSDRGVFSVAFSPDGQTIAVGEGNGGIDLWDLSSRSQIATLTDQPSAVHGVVVSVAFSPDGKTIAASEENGNTYLWDVPRRSLIATLADSPSLFVRSVAFSPDGKTIAVGDANGSAYLWDLASQSPIATLTGPSSGDVYSVAFSPDGKTIAAANTNGSTYLWLIS
jgi:serine/threonine protein kinase/WD40 repeat protein